MKYLLSLVIATLLVIASCKKHKDDDIPGGTDDGCIQRIFIKTKDHAISSADAATVDSLFSKAKKDYSNLRYYQYKHDTIQDEYAPYAKHDRKMVWTEQHNRGLTCFNTDWLYVFVDDTYNPAGSFDNIDVSFMVSSMDTIPISSLPRVRKLFRHDLEKYFPSDSSSNRIDYSDTCFVAEFGFYKDIINKHKDLKFYKAWRVFKKNSRNDRPVGYYDDATGKQISFWLF